MQYSSAVNHCGALVMIIHKTRESIEMSYTNCELNGNLSMLVVNKRNRTYISLIFFRHCIAAMNPNGGSSLILQYLAQRALLRYNLIITEQARVEKTVA